MSNAIPTDVNRAFEAIPAPSRKALLKIRQLILDCASGDQAIGELTETLKWGEPAYLTEQSGSGSTIRLGIDDKKPDTVAVYFNCQTTLVKDMQSKFPGKLECENNRVIYFPVKDPLPSPMLSECLSMALTYHLNKKQRAAGLI